MSVDRLGDLVESTHTVKPAYKPARELYPWVDLQPDGKLRSLYTAQEFEPEDLIRADFEVLQARVAQLMRATILGEDDQATIEAEAEAEAQLPFNCEHVVPQSWFAKAEPMRGDLHHLFVCESGCNSFRGNTAYAEFPDSPRRHCPVPSARWTWLALTAVRASPADSNPPTARAQRPAPPAISGCGTPD